MPQYVHQLVSNFVCVAFGANQVKFTLSFELFNRLFHMQVITSPIVKANPIGKLTMRKREQRKDSEGQIVTYWTS